MSAAMSFGDKVFKMVALVCAASTVVGLSTIGVNVYYNTGKNRNPVSPPPPSEMVEDPGSDELGTKSISSS